jgi:predicted RNA-binding protein YlxR (DUF448 family)
LKNIISPEMNDGNAGLAHIPIRTCVICRERFPKTALARYTVLATPGETAPGLVEDRRRTRPGRGFYACGKPACRERVAKFQGWRKKGKGGGA